MAVRTKLLAHTKDIKTTVSSQLYNSTREYNFSFQIQRLICQPHSNLALYHFQVHMLSLLQIFVLQSQRTHLISTKKERTQSVSIFSFLASYVTSILQLFLLCIFLQLHFIFLTHLASPFVPNDKPILHK
jgi:hypothetical protein